MKTRLFVLVAACVMLGASLAGADDQPDAKILLDKAMIAMNGEAKLAKLGTVAAKAKLVGAKDGQEWASTIDVTWQGISQYRVDFAYQGSGRNGTGVIVLNGEKGWASSSVTDTTELLPKEIVPFIHNMFYAWRIPQLLPALRNKSFTLSPLGEVKVDDKAAMGISISHKDRKDVSLFFDKKSGLPVKSAIHLERPKENKEMAIEFRYTDYKAFGSVKLPSKIALGLDDKLERTMELSEIKLLEKLDDSHFGEP